jgi:hypothetical protein
MVAAAAVVLMVVVVVVVVVVAGVAEQKFHDGCRMIMNKLLSFITE